MERPKRRKFKDNPYTLLYEDNANKYYLLFKDAYNVINKIEVTHANKWNSITKKDII